MTSHGRKANAPACAAKKPAITQEYSVTVVTPDRVAMNHFDTTSSESHSALLSMRTSVVVAFFHIARLIAMRLI